MHLDANECAFFMRELEYIKSVTYDIKYKPLKALLLFPTSTEANTGASQITWRQFALVGNAKIIGDDANDLPLADTYGVENPYKVKTVGVKYRYTIQEIRESMFAGKRLDQRKAAAARRAVDQTINSIALIGDSDNGDQRPDQLPGHRELLRPCGWDGIQRAVEREDRRPDQPGRHRHDQRGLQRHQRCGVPGHAAHARPAVRVHRHHAG